MNVRGLVGALLPAFFVLDLGYFAGKRRSFDADQAIELSARNLPFRASRSGRTLTVRSTFSVGLPLIVFGRQLLGRQSGKHRPEPGDSGVGAVTYRMPTLSRILGAAFLLFGLALAPNAKPIELSRRRSSVANISRERAIAFRATRQAAAKPLPVAVG